MNASFRPLNLDRSYWTVLSPGDDPITATSKDEAELVYRSLFRTEGVRIVEFNPVEGWAFDVTDSFFEDEREDDAHGIPSPDSLLRWHNSRVL